MYGAFGKAHLGKLILQRRLSVAGAGVHETTDVIVSQGLGAFHGPGREKKQLVK